MLRNLSSLSPEDQEAFVELLKSGAPRFVVHRLSTAYPLLSKGILRSVQILDDLDWICEFHPAITNRAKLLPLAEGHRDGALGIYDQSMRSDLNIVRNIRT